MTQTDKAPGGERERVARIIAPEFFDGSEAKAYAAEHMREKALAKADAILAALRSPGEAVAFQDRVVPWLMECFGAEIAGDRVERCDRFIEEALELAQSLDWTADRAHALVDYVFGRPQGEPHQEVGGVMVTLAALCQAVGLDMQRGGDDELARIMQPDIVAKIRAKQAAKPTGSALPVAQRQAPGGERWLGQSLKRAAIDKQVMDLRPGIRDAIKRGWTPDAILAALREGGSWQPIETAPKDGTRLLAFVAELEAVDFIQWQERHGSPVGWRDSFIRVYRDNDAGGPTHWMPLPKPPASSGEA